MKTLKTILRLSLLLCVVLLCALSVYAASEPAFRFSLQTDGLAEKRVSTGDIITVVFSLERTDSSDPYTMYAMQNEIRYDSSFFEPVDDSFFLKDGIFATDTRYDDYERELYMNFLSFTGGVSWNAKTNVGSFQMRVTGTAGASLISSRDCIVSLPDAGGSYALVTSDIIIVVSDDCSVVFLSNGGSAVDAQTVTRGEKAVVPSAPVRDGYRFDGWYTDRNCTDRWNPDEPIRYNLRLYAGWVEGEEAAEPIQLPFTDVAADAWYYDNVRYVFENGMMIGTADTLFSPETATSRSMLVTILWRLEGAPVVDHAMTFEDVAEGAWYTEAIRWAAANGIVLGYSDTTFGVEDAVTREQTATFLHRYAAFKGYECTADTDAAFKDWSAVSDWAKASIRWAVGEGLILGTDQKMLDPLGTAARAQTAAILMRFCEMK